MSWHIYILASNSLKFLNYIYMENNKKLKPYNPNTYTNNQVLYNSKNLENLKKYQKISNTNKDI